MVHQSLRDSLAASEYDAHAADLPSPFGKLDGLDSDDLCQTAYEIFFTACRSSPGFGGRNAVVYYPSEGGDGSGSGQGSPGKSPGVGMAVTSRVKRTLGLKMLKRPHSRRTSSSGSNPSSPSCTGLVSSPGFAFTVPQMRSRRPLTSAEIMRQQMRVAEKSDNRLRKTLLRTLVGQMGRRAETIILPLELLRHLKPSEFSDSQEYHFWQKRQLKLLETGLLHYPSIPLDKSNKFSMRLRDIIQACDTKPIDTGKNSDTMRTLCNSVVSLSWRSTDDSPNDICHWADGYPLNVHIYTELLHSIFDLKDETLILDEVDELMELMKKTWSTLGINRSLHNLCFTWLLFKQYVITGQVEADLLGATLAMLAEVANDAKKVDREPIYPKILASVLTSMKLWSEKRLLDYHENFQKETVSLIESILPLVFSVTEILEEDVPGYVAAAAAAEEGEKGEVACNETGNRVDHYIRSSLRNAFAKMLENGNANGTTFEVQDAGEALIKVAKETQDLAVKEKEIFSPVFKKWHPIATGVAAVTLHSYYGTLLKQYLSAGASLLTNDTIMVLKTAGKLENVLVQMVVEETVECEDGGKTIVREMVPYEVDSIILGLLKQWLQERLKKGKEFLHGVKETETWNPKSKTEPYANSAVELMKHAKEAVDDFFEVPIAISETLVHDLADGFEHLFKDYTTFVASCGAKQNYVPTLPPLTRCNRDSKFIKLWKIASPCSVGMEGNDLNGSNEGNDPRPSTSRGTQRLYIRLNTLHYLLSQLNSLDKTLSLSPRVVPSPHNRLNNRRRLTNSSSYFNQARLAIQAATQHVSEVAAYRLVFLDSNSVFYGSLYVDDVENARIKPALRILKQNLTLLCAILNDRAQPLALKEVMKASFEAYLTVLLAGGSSRVFCRSDHQMIEEDFDSLKRVFLHVWGRIDSRGCGGEGG